MILPQKSQHVRARLRKTQSSDAFNTARVLIRSWGMSAPKRFVYILKSVAKPDTYYVGLTSNVRRRLEAHNEGLSAHTSEHRPWRTLVVIEFDEEAPALEFERYLKTGSGREFARRHFRQTVRAHGARKH